MSTQLKEFESKCSVCSTYQPKQCKETLLPHELPNRPCANVGVDLYIFENRNYLIVIVTLISPTH